MAIIKLDKLMSVHFDHLYASEMCIKEISKAMKGCGSIKKFQEWLLNRLQEIDDYSLSYVDLNPNQFERIDEFYNITYRHKEKNIRIIFSKEENGDVNVLLCAFDEKNSGDYQLAKRLARKRQKEERE